MIRAVHNLIYSSDPEATRRFLTEVLEWPSVSAHGGDGPDGWLIYETGPSELGVHPATGTDGEQWTDPGRHEISLVCDDITATVADLQARGAEFDGDVIDRGFGQVVQMQVPGAGFMLLYQPHHETAYQQSGQR